MNKKLIINKNKFAANNFVYVNCAILRNGSIGLENGHKTIYVYVCGFGFGYILSIRHSNLIIYVSDPKNTTFLKNQR